MKFLWAPWRMSYIMEKRQGGCFLCKNLLEKKDAENYILYRGSYSFVMMNKFPYNNGHLMVAPKRHCIALEDLRGKETEELFELLKISTKIVKEALHPHGFNVGINIGKVGGAGEEHLHIHIVPRWAGDTNFMPILGEAKVISQYLKETYETLRLSFKPFLKKGLGRKGVKRP